MTPKQVKEIWARTSQVGTTTRYTKWNKGGQQMHGILTMLDALRYALESLDDDTLIDTYEDTICNAKDIIMDVLYADR